MDLEHGKIGGTQFCDQLHCRSNGSINYTARTEVRLFTLIRAEWRATNLFVSANKKPNYYEDDLSSVVYNKYKEDDL
jgi:hypothetical protein